MLIKEIPVEEMQQQPQPIQEKPINEPEDEDKPRKRKKAKKNAVFAIIAFFIALNGIIIAKFVGKIKQFSP